MQHICNRSLLITRANACIVRYVSAPAISYRKNKEWDYFKGIPMSAVTSRRGFQGGRALACKETEHLEPVKILQGLTCEKHPILTDGSKNNEPVELHVLSQNTLFLFFSSLNKSESHISDLNLVYEEVKKGGGMCKIVWIPIVEPWNEKAEKEFERLRAKMPWYTAEYRSPILHRLNKYGYNGEPILVVMNPQGDVKTKNGFPLIRKNGILEAFPFLRRAQ